MSDALPYSYDRDSFAGDLAAEFAELAPGSETEREVTVAGRVMLIRRHGGVAFATLRDMTGEIQLMVSKAKVGDESFERFTGLGMGDWVGARGNVLSTRRGELSIGVGEWLLLVHAERQIPKEVHSPADPDLRYRERHLDLMLNADVRRVFAIRSDVIAALRAELGQRRFVEVETPVLGAQAGGAAARPFVTHHNALDTDMYLRIALELPLKKLVVGGIERVFEIGRVFRNEGLDRRHNPEFTMLEAYQALTDYEGMMELTQALIVRAAREATGSTNVESEGDVIDLAGEWRRVSMAEFIAERLGAEMHPSMPLEDARRVAREHGIEPKDSWGAGKLMVEVYETVELELQQPTFVCDHPIETSPLARSHRDDPELVERFELIIGGREIANAYSELNDPGEQRRRFEAEVAKRVAGDEEANPLDAEFVKALEYGLPPTGGLGIGIDRLVMLLSGAPSIREAILFPTLRPRPVNDADGIAET